MICQTKLISRPIRDASNFNYKCMSKLLEDQNVFQGLHQRICTFKYFVKFFADSNLTYLFHLML